jgi:hypothetical protein
MKKGGAEIMHGSNTFTDVYKNLEDLCFRKTFAQTSIHHINNSTTWTKFHENEDFVHAGRHFVPRGIDQMHHIWVPLQYPHDIDFFLNLREHGLIRNADAFENMMCRVVHGSGSPNKIHVGESALAEIPLNLDRVLIYGDCLTWNKSTLVLLHISL